MKGQVKWVGWIKSHIVGKNRLRKLGVRGKMKYNVRHRCFEHCEVSDDVMDILIAQWPGFNPRCFTGIDQDGEQLPSGQQRYWHYGQ